MTDTLPTVALIVAEFSARFPEAAGLMSPDTLRGLAWIQASADEMIEECEVLAETLGAICPEQGSLRDLASAPAAKRLEFANEARRLARETMSLA